MSKFLEFFGFVSPEEADGDEPSGMEDSLSEERNVPRGRADETVGSDASGAAGTEQTQARPSGSFAFAPSTVDDEVASEDAAADDIPVAEYGTAETDAVGETVTSEGLRAGYDAGAQDAEGPSIPPAAPPSEGISEPPPSQPSYISYEAPAREDVRDAVSPQEYVSAAAPQEETQGISAPAPSVEDDAEERAAPAPSVEDDAEGFSAPAAFVPREAYAGDVAASAEKTEDGSQAGETKKTISVIAEDAYIDGNVTTSGNIEVFGGISGDVRAKGAVDVRGAIRGDVSGEKLGLYGCTVQGNMRATSGILVDSESMVIGDVKTKNIYLDGKLKGNIESDEVSLLRSNAYYVGDIVTGSIAIEGGATIIGNIRTLIEDDVEDPFKPDRMSGLL